MLQGFFVATGGGIEVEVNVEKTKYMSVSRPQNVGWKITT